VWVESLSVLGFRNLAAAKVRFGPGVTLITGPNGAGKTNLLEATYFALVGRSCRTRSEREAIAFGEPLARAEATVVAGAERREFLCAVDRAAERRHLLDGTALGPRATTMRPPLSVFMPDRLALVKGPPSGRRSHLDGFCAALWPAREEPRRRYGRALAQRNALLGRVRSGRAAGASLEAWEQELAEAGSELVAVRARAVERLAGPFREAAGGLGLPGEALLEYRPRTREHDADSISRELAERRAADVARGYTSWGPHLDELAIESDGRSLRRYGSQGQQRIALLGLLFAEREVLIEDGRALPLMLLDDVTSELDGERRRLLAERLALGGQALVTAAEPKALPVEGERSELAVRAGRVMSSLAGGEAAAA
jgi:DNA replication and repair protein RecF